MGYKIKCDRGVGGILTRILIACFLVSVYFYFSASSDSFIARRKPGKENTKNKNSKTPPILSCDLKDIRSEVCEINSNVRIHSSSSSIFFSYNQPMDLETNKTWRVQPYTRKFDDLVMKSVRPVTIRPFYAYTEAPKCDLNHNITAVVFSSSSYLGNFYHDFSDVLLPLFITARQFEGEVQFLIADMQLWWVEKYKKILNQLSNYEIIDSSKEKQVHCYPSAIVGLYSHGELTVDPSRTPNSYSMLDFARLIRKAYFLDRDFAKNLAAGGKTKPRLLIIARNQTRKIVNVGEVVAMGDELGFEVVVSDPASHTTVDGIARLVNSIDVMIGVHGAGLTNQIFLPTNAVLIQIVPFGNLEKFAEYDYGFAAKNMMLQYLQYSISEEESTLIDIYPRDHAVFRDPKSIHRQGWAKIDEIYLRQQSVKLNLPRFRPVLKRALELLT
ncbi:hypothetical protein LUZ62_074292 [Rhynchospora pubera]|uniref:Glycosyltransferase 61 catalytic domain-containing protein n=1 Tax=Rhynchospora pubera TaxID=906938 RepID=A0AAV8DB97_9POAL|nr:hypothetical protein LUZ62_074292 [Rhynchospora pubera]